MANGNLAEAFDRYYDVDVYPPVPREIALTKGVHGSAIDRATELGYDPLDLRKEDPKVALRELSRHHVAAVLGRDALDKALQKLPPDAFHSLAHDAGVHVIARFGNGVNFDVQAAYNNGGIVVLRTPRGNAEALRIYQDLALLALLRGHEDRARPNNPVFDENARVKEGHVKKSEGWDRHNVTDAVNPNMVPFEQASDEAKRCAELFRGRKVCVIGPGRIGQEVIKQSVFLKYADVTAYDVNPEMRLNGVKMATSLEQALEGAELLLIHMDGQKTIIGDKELALLKRGAVVCNFARGKIVDSKALYNAMRDGRVKGAALDTHWEEEDALKPFMEESGPGEDQTLSNGYFAHLLRMSPRVMATNHSSASDETAQMTHVVDGMSAVHRDITRGEIIDGVLTPRNPVQFPYSAFVSEVGDSSVVIPSKLRSQRIALQLIHDGTVPGLLIKAWSDLREVLGGEFPNIVKGGLEPWEYERDGVQYSNAIDFHAIELPRAIADLPKGEKERVLRGIAMRATSFPAVRRARVFAPRRKEERAASL